MIMITTGQKKKILAAISQNRANYPSDAKHATSLGISTSVYSMVKQGGKRRTLTDGGFYAWTSKMDLNPNAEFWRAMALMKVGKTIKIPKRQFLGMAPEVEREVTKIIEDELEEYFNHLNI